MSVFDGITLPNVVYKAKSKYNDSIEVVDHAGTRKLVVNHHTQSINADSPLAEKMVWGRTVKLLKEEEPDLQTILVLGMGGGTMQHMLAKEFSGVVIVSVDIDDVIVEIAKKFFSVSSIPNHFIIADDACRVIIEPDKFNLKHNSFQVVVVDIFIGDEYPDLGKSGNFLAHIAKMVVQGGLVIVNRVYLEDHQEDVHNFIDSLEFYLKDIKTIIVPGKTNSDNMLIYGRT